MVASQLSFKAQTITPFSFFKKSAAGYPPGLNGAGVEFLKVFAKVFGGSSTCALPVATYSLHLGSDLRRVLFTIMGRTGWAYSRGEMKFGKGNFGPLVGPKFTWHFHMFVCACVHACMRAYMCACVCMPARFLKFFFSI
mmetsp:Transcript_117315/g.204274  ORF Transcript_117315/g.204274 Transcript_117315/m.204274 type:complete len:139 (+) Transcript_117315:243-659(+)